MSRVINTYSVGKERTHLTKGLVIAIQEFFKQKEQNRVARDTLSFMVIALEKLEDNINRTVTPWEKRDYWVKADKFRMEWRWVGPLAKKLDEAFRENSIGDIVAQVVALGEKLNHIKVSPRHRMGKPWLGAWEEYQKRQNNI